MPRGETAPVTITVRSAGNSSMFDPLDLWCSDRVDVLMSAVLFDRGRAKIFDELLHEHIGLVPVRDQLRNPLGGDIQETRSGLGAEFSRRDQVGEDLWGREAFRESGLQRFVAEVVDVQASHICDGERAEERQPEPKGGAHQCVDVLGSGSSVLDQLGGLMEEGVLQAIEDKAGDVLHDSRGLACLVHNQPGRLDGGLIGAGVRNDFDAGTNGDGLLKWTPRKRPGFTTAVAIAPMEMVEVLEAMICLLYTSPSPRDGL